MAQTGYSYNKDVVVTTILELFEQGYMRAVIKEMILAQNEFSEHVAEELLEVATSIIREKHATDLEALFFIHLARYDKMIVDLSKKDYSNYSPKTQFRLQVSAHYDMLDILHQKERLLGFHNKGTYIRFNQQNNFNVEEKPEKFDLSKLTLEEKIDLLSLMKKATNKNDPWGVILSGNKVTEDEEVIDETVNEIVNVDKIQTYNNQQEFEKEIEGIKNIDTIKNKLWEALKKKAAEEFKKAGGKIKDGEV